MQFLEKLFRSANPHLLPTACVICQNFQCSTICKTCLTQLLAEGLLNYECCRQCGIALQASEVERQYCIQCLINRPHFDETYCLDRYDGPLQEALHQLKYQKRLAFAHGLASAWNQAFKNQLANSPANYLLPVPLSIQKLATRGFNQSWELARHLNCSSYIQKSPHILWRQHHEKHQAGRSLISRRDLIQDMFYIHPNYIKFLENKVVIVFDDVMTSGATLNEIARVLKDNGVSRVINWVLLRTSRPI